MKKVNEYGFVYAVGALGYGAIEVLWRGHTHWTMILTGGAGFSGLYLLSKLMSGRRLLTRCVAGSAVLTAVELASGCIVNLWLGMRVWDYSSFPGNLFGQICPQYSFLWFLLCIPVMPFSKHLRRCFSGQRRVASSVGSAVAQVTENNV